MQALQRITCEWCQSLNLPDALTCVACLVLRRRRPDAPRLYRPHWTIPALAVCAAVALLISAGPKRDEFLFAGAMLVLGFFAWGATALLARTQSVKAAPPAP